MKKFLILAASFIILAAAVGGAAYNYYKKGPLYSLKLAGEAIQENNPILIDKYIDMDGLLGKMIDEKLSEDPEFAGNPFAVGFANMFKPTLISTLKTSFFSSFQKKKAEYAQKGEEREYLKSVKVLNKDNTAATVELILYGKNNKDIKIILAMQKKEDYWQIKYILNSKEVYYLIEENMPDAEK